MRLSELFFFTLRETPGEAEIPSHRLMLRAGMIRRLAAGIYTFLPLGCRVFRKVEAIVREEMDRSGAQEVLLPAMQPVELWEESGRLTVYREERILFELEDRQGRRYALGPTHEEVITDMARARIRSYRDLPFNLYQIQTKFRDEIRPRFGLIRGREFSMKDAYSFDADEAGMRRHYEIMRETYMRIFRRCGLKFRAVEADSGAIGGSASAEFMVLAPTGEETIAWCAACDYAANLEKAEGRLPDAAGTGEAALDREDVFTPDQRTVEEVSGFLKQPPEKFIKTLLFQTVDGSRVYAALVRGDCEVNEVKLKNAAGSGALEMASEDVVRRVTGAPAGFAGPHALDPSVVIVMDRALENCSNMISGAGKKDAHAVNLNRGRDFREHILTDIRNAREGDGCPRCDGVLRFDRGIEVGHIFQLGTKYSEKMGLHYTDADGQILPVQMGCYGIGVSRAAAAAVEQGNDDDGIIWPIPIAPYHAVVIPASMKNVEQTLAAESCCEKLNGAGVETVLDDRDERIGVKFKDADLIGFPFKVIVGKALERGEVEVQFRTSKEKAVLPLDEAMAKIAGEVRRALSEGLE